MNDYYNEVQLKFIIKMQKKLFDFWRTSSPDSQPGLWPSALLGDFRPQTLSCPLFVFPRCALADDGNVSATKLSHAAGDWEAPVEDDEVQICRRVFLRLIFATSCLCIFINLNDKRRSWAMVEWSSGRPFLFSIISFNWYLRNIEGYKHVRPHLKFRETVPVVSP